MLAARLGVALIIILVVSNYLSMLESKGISTHTPKIEVVKGEMDEDGESNSDVIHIGGITIDPEKDSIMDIERKMAGLDTKAFESSIEELSEQDAFISEAEVERIRADRERVREDQIALEAQAEAIREASKSIAQEFTAQPDETPVEEAPNKLSEKELQSLIVERLLSVQKSADDPVASQPGLGMATDPDLDLGDSADMGVVAAPMDVRELPEPVGVPDLPAGAPAPVPTSPVIYSSRDFSGQTLMGRDFRNQKLTGFNFANAKLTAANFDQSLIENADFSGARLQGASFVDASLAGSNFQSALLQTAIFIGADLRGVDFSEANLAGADLTGADLRGAILTNTTLSGTILDGALLDPPPSP